MSLGASSPSNSTPDVYITNWTENVDGVEVPLKLKRVKQNHVSVYRRD